MDKVAAKRAAQQAAVAAAEQAVRDDLWNQEQQERLEVALLAYTATMHKDERWAKVASDVGDGKSRNQCLARYKFIKNHLFPLPVGK
jgi:hypothetical protein